MKRIGAVLALAVVLISASATGGGSRGRQIAAVQAATEELSEWGRFPAGSYAVMKTTTWDRKGRSSRPAVTEVRLTRSAGNASLPRVETEIRSLPAVFASAQESLPATLGAGVEVLSVSGATFLCRWSEDRSTDGLTVTKVWRSRRAPGEVVKLVRISNGGSQTTISELSGFGVPGAL